MIASGKLEATRLKLADVVLKKCLVVIWGKLWLSRVQKVQVVSGAETYLRPILKDCLIPLRVCEL